MQKYDEENIDKKEEEKIKNIDLEALMKRNDENEDVITSEFLLKKINETIEFDKKMQDPEFVKAIEIGKERMRNLDFSQFFKDEETDLTDE